MNFSKILKKYLFSLIDEMGQNHALYTRNPNRDFSQIKKWSFSKTLLCTLSIGADVITCQTVRPAKGVQSGFVVLRKRYLSSFANQPRQQNKYILLDKSIRKKDFGQFKLLCDRWRYL